MDIKELMGNKLYSPAYLSVQKAILKKESLKVQDCRILSIDSIVEEDGTTKVKVIDLSVEFEEQNEIMFFTLEELIELRIIYLESEKKRLDNPIYKWKLS